MLNKRFLLEFSFACPACILVLEIYLFGVVALAVGFIRTNGGRLGLPSPESGLGMLFN